MTNQDEYFSVQAQLLINVEAVEDDDSEPNHATLSQEKPLIFEIAHQSSELERQLENELSAFPYESITALTKLFRIQSDRINLLLGFLLTQQSDSNSHFYTRFFGASGLIFGSNKTFETGQSVKIKIFIESPPTALFCYGVIEDCYENTAKNSGAGKYSVQLKYVHLQETDKDLLIRAALLEQQKILRKRALNRKK